MSFINLLQIQAKDMDEYVKTTYSLFFNWFTFFMTLNLTALVFLCNLKFDIEFKTLKIIIALVFLIFDVYAVRICKRMDQHLTQKADEIHDIRKKIWKESLSNNDDTSHWEHFKMTTPKDFAQFAIKSHIQGVRFMGLVWFIFIIITIYFYLR